MEHSVQFRMSIPLSKQKQTNSPLNRTSLFVLVNINLLTGFSLNGQMLLLKWRLS